MHSQLELDVGNMSWILYNHNKSTGISWNFGVHCVSRQMCYLLWEIYLLVQLLSFTYLQLYTMSVQNCSLGDK